MVKNSHYPFNYHEGMQLIKKEPKYKIFTDIKKLFSEHQLTEEDTIILNVLCKYGYLNAFLIRILLEQNMSECTQSFVTKRLAYLESKGLVQRFQFMYTDKDDIEHATPFIYEAAYKTKKLFQKNVDIDPREEIETILRRLSFNQFHVFLERQMAGTLTFSATHFNGKSDGAYRFFSQGKPVNFYVFSIRSLAGWRGSYIERLRAFIDHMKINGLTCSGVIVICENEMQCLLAEQHRKTISDCKDISVYYICDYAAVMEGYILGHLIHVNPENNYSTYDIIKVPVDGNIHQNTVKQEDKREDNKNDKDSKSSEGEKNSTTISERNDKPNKNSKEPEELPSDTQKSKKNDSSAVKSAKPVKKNSGEKK